MWQESKTSQSVPKDQICHNKDNKSGFQAVKMFISTHNSFKTTCSCILPLSVTDIIWGREFEVKCRWHTGLMWFVLCLISLLFNTPLGHVVCRKQCHKFNLKFRKCAKSKTQIMCWWHKYLNILVTLIRHKGYIHKRGTCVYVACILCYIYGSKVKLLLSLGLILAFKSLVLKTG